MKVVFCLGSLHKGGAERVVSNLANYYAGLGNDVVIITTKSAESSYDLDKKIKVLSLDTTGARKSFRNIRRIARLREVIDDVKPDVIFGFLQEPIARLLVAKALFKNIKKTPTIISIRIDPKKAFSSFKRKMSLPLYNIANGFVFQTEEAKKFFNKKIQARSKVIANPLDPVFYLGNNGDTLKREKRIVAVGRLTRQKNYPLMLDAFAEVNRKIPGYVLEIYGDGPLKGDIEEYIRKKGLKKNVKLMGEVSDIKSHFNNASVFVMTSDYEGLSNALMEAMAVGVPCVSTNSSGGGAASLIEDGKNGFLVPVGDKAAISEAIEKVLLDDTLAEKFSKAAVKDMKKYRPEKINREWEEYASDVMVRHGEAR